MEKAAEFDFGARSDWFYILALTIVAVTVIVITYFFRNSFPDVDVRGANGERTTLTFRQDFQTLSTTLTQSLRTEFLELKAQLSRSHDDLAHKLKMHEEEMEMKFRNVTDRLDQQARKLAEFEEDVRQKFRTMNDTFASSSK